MTGEAAPLPAPLGAQVTLYCVIGLPPLEDGAPKAICACALPGVATPMTGMPGATGLMVTLRVTCDAAA